MLHTRTVRTKSFVTALAVLLALLGTTAVVGSWAAGWSLHQALDAFVVSNLVIGVSFGLCGVLIAWNRPRHPVGWLLLVGGLCQTASAAAAPLTQLSLDAGQPLWQTRTLITAFFVLWPVHIGVCLPLSLVLLPDGHLPSRRWRWAFVGIALLSPLFVLASGNGHSDGTYPDGYLLLPLAGWWHVLWSAVEPIWVASMLVGVCALVTRYRRGDETVRRQLLWVVVAAGAVFAAVTPWALISGTPIAVLFAVPLLPAGITVAILRHRLLDVRVVVARAAAYLLLSALIFAGYALLVVWLSGITSALLMALLALPLRDRLQVTAERLLYGDRGDPARLATRVGAELHDLQGALEQVRSGLRLPYAAIRARDGTYLVSCGEVVATTESTPLDADHALEIGLRPGERHLGARDQRVLSMLTGPLAVAVTAATTANALLASRGRLVTAREEERRRLQRDLHDGLGTLLTGVVLIADAASNTVDSDPKRAALLLGSVRSELRTAVAEVHRLVADLAPLAVDELGLVRALEVRAAQAATRADGQPLEVTVVSRLAEPLPAALEVAAYRIATEALTNVVRHARATRATISLVTADGMLEVEVLDDGGWREWGAGVGTASMRERAEELGGRCDPGPRPEGGAVRALLPIGVA